MQNPPYDRYALMVDCLTRPGPFARAMPLAVRVDALPCREPRRIIWTTIPQAMQWARAQTIVDNVCSTCGYAPATVPCYACNKGGS